MFLEMQSLSQLKLPLISQFIMISWRTIASQILVHIVSNTNLLPESINPFGHQCPLITSEKLFHIKLSAGMLTTKIHLTF